MSSVGPHQHRPSVEPEPAAPPQYHGGSPQRPRSQPRRSKKRMEEPVECALENNRHVVIGSLDDDEDDEETELTWRLDPQRSLSDWAVVVTTRETGAARVYNVHKNILGVGPRRSLYFARLFAAHARKQEELQEQLLRQQQMEEHLQRQSKHERDKKGRFPKQFAFHSGLEPCEMITRTLRHDRGPATASEVGLDFDLDLPQQQNQSNHMVTELELPQVAADVLPQIFDYIYSGGAKLEVNTHTATALHFLADLFEIKALRRMVRGFWQQDLSVDNLCLYYRHAATVGDVPILRHAQEFCARNIFEIPEDYVVQVLTAVDADFFFHVISHHAAIEAPERNGGGSSTDSLDEVLDEEEDGDRGEEKSNKSAPQRDTRTISSKRLSLIIAVYCNIHRQDLNPNEFLRLVSPDILPEIDLKAAKVLLELEYYICRDKDKLTSLKKRCIKVMSKKWDHICVDTRDFGIVSLPRLGGEALERFVSLSFTNAKERLATLDQIFMEWDKVQGELQRLRTEVRHLREEKKNFYGEDIVETFGASLPSPAKSQRKGSHVTEIKKKIEAKQVSAPSLTSSANESSTSSSFVKKAGKVNHGAIGMSEPGHEQHLARQMANSYYMNEQMAMATSLPEYAEIVKGNLPTQFDAINMARSRQKIALSAYEEAVAKLKLTVAESEVQAAVEQHLKYDASSRISAPVSDSTSHIIPEPMHEQVPVRAESDAGSFMGGRLNSSDWNEESDPRIRKVPVVSGVQSREKTMHPHYEATRQETHVRTEWTPAAPHASQGTRIASSSDHHAVHVYRNAVDAHHYVPAEQLGAYRGESGAASSATPAASSARSVYNAGIQMKFSDAESHVSASCGPMMPQTPIRSNQSRSQDLIKDATTTAKSLFSFTKNYIKTYASQMNDNGNAEYGRSTNEGQAAPSSAGASQDAPNFGGDASAFAASPVSVAVFESAPTQSFDLGSLGSLVKEAIATPGPQEPPQQVQMVQQLQQQQAPPPRPPPPPPAPRQQAAQSHPATEPAAEEDPGALRPRRIPAKSVPAAPATVTGVATTASSVTGAASVTSTQSW